MPLFPGTPGDDSLYGTNDPDMMTGLAGNDRLWGFGGDDILDGGDDSDILDGGTGADSMTGGAGNDFFIVDDPGDLVIELAGGGSDFVYTYIDYSLPDHVERLAVYSRVSTYAVNLTGNALANELIGNDGANFLDGGDGADIMQGAGGDDEYFYTSGDRVDEGPGGGNDTIWLTSGITGFSFRSFYPTLSTTYWVENLGVYDRSSTHSVDLQGYLGTNLLWGNDGANRLDGWHGADTMTGYGGDDIYYIDNAGDVVVEDAAAGFDTIITGQNYGTTWSSIASYQLPDNVERLIGFVGTVTGNDLDNEIIIPILSPSTPSTTGYTIDGGAGADIMRGANGDDTYYVDNAGDRVIDPYLGYDKIYTTVSYKLDSVVEALAVRDAASTNAIDLTGNEHANDLYGNDGVNVLDGGTNYDSMYGHGGDDTYFVDHVLDRVVEDADDGYDTVFVANVNFTLGANVERSGALDRTSTTAFSLTGNADENELWGNDGANVIDGKAGRDVLQGLGGADQFVFSTPLTGYSNIDQLIDFLAGTDTIALDNAIFEALAPGALAASSFRIATEAQDADDFIMYDPTTGFLYYDGDANGSDRYPVPFAEVHETTPLTAADFVVI